MQWIMAHFSAIMAVFATCTTLISELLPLLTDGKYVSINSWVSSLLQKPPAA